MRRWGAGMEVKETALYGTPNAAELCFPADLHTICGRRSFYIS
jgi:hypothetical protein